MNYSWRTEPFSEGSPFETAGYRFNPFPGMFTMGTTPSSYDSPNFAFRVSLCACRAREPTCDQHPQRQSSSNCSAGRMVHCYSSSSVLGAVWNDRRWSLGPAKRHSRSGGGLERKPKRRWHVCLRAQRSGTIPHVYMAVGRHHARLDSGRVVLRSIGRIRLLRQYCGSGFLKGK